MDTKTSVSSLSQEVAVPLIKLRLSPRNARRPHKSDKEAGVKQSLESLAASILHLGVVQNLVVTQADDKAYEVEAGGRRWKALQLLLKADKIPDTYPVRCLLIPIEAALTVSLTENIQREAMHPVDEFAAFKKLADEGMAMEDIAAAFGVVPVVVKRRLKLANVSPKLLKLFRDGEATLEQLMALAITDDHKAQEAAFLNKPDWQRRPDELRSMLTENDIEAARDPVAKFVSVEAYKAAGGAMRTDLFAEEGNGVYLSDAGLLERLATDKLAETIEGVKGEGWSWVNAAPRVTSSEFYNWVKVAPGRRKATPEESKKLAALEKKQQAIQKKMDADEDGERYDEQNAQLEPIIDEIEGIRTSQMIYAKKYLEVSGAVVCLDRNGAVGVVRGLVRTDDVKRLKALDSKKKGSKEAVEAEAAKPSMSESLTRRLTACRTVALQAELAVRPDIALVVVTHKLALSALGEPRQRSEGPAKISSTINTGLCNHAPEIEGSRAQKVLQELRARLTDGLDTGEDGEIEPVKLFAHLLTLPQADVLALLALCSALSVDVVQGRVQEEDSAAALAKALNLDMSKWWTPSATGYFNHISKLQTIEAVSEFAADKIEGLESLKKGELTAKAEKLAEGSGWLPAVLRAPQ